MSKYELITESASRRAPARLGLGASIAKLRRDTALALQATEAQLVASSPYDQSAWAILYGALVNGYGVSPQNFQMVYPYIAWNWKTENLGYIGASAYDTLSTIPAWTAVGQYTSTGARFNAMYQAFLNVISPDTSDPDLRKQIEELYNILVDASNTYNRTVQQAKDAYNADSDPGKGDFTHWLGTISGKAWQTQIASADKNMTQAQNNYDAKVNEAKTPNLNEALAAFANQDYYAKLNDPNLAAMPKVPSWGTSIQAQQWADKAARGDVPGGAISFSNSDQKYDYSKTWAKSSASVGNWFWSVKVSGQWQRIDEFESDANLAASINFKGIELIAVQPSPWYMGVTNLQNGPYKRGYSKDGKGSTTAVFGEKGFLPMLKTGMYVVYQPSFSITVDQSTFQSFDEMFKVCTGLRIGPFNFEAEGGSEKAGWNASASGLSFTGTTTSTEPYIFGFTVQLLP